MTDRWTVAVVGAGAMGHGFAVHFDHHGHDVSLVDHRQSNLDDARERIRDVVAFLNDEGLAERDAETVLDTVDFTLDRATAVADADLVLETVSEDLATKRALFADLAREAAADAVLATNTSGLPVTDIAAEVPAAAERIVGCHWWFPPYLLTPVEVIPGERTSEDAYERVVDFVESVDRDPIRVRKDAPGFVWNRVQFALFRECLHIVEEGIAAPEDVNRAIRDGYAVRTAAIGPFETMDLAGLDLIETIADDLYPHLADDDAATVSLRERVATGRTGVDAGEGFFEYDEDADVARERDETVAAIRQALAEREARRERGGGAE